MIRDLTYAIQFATANELTLVHGMTLDEDISEGRHETFHIEGRGVHGASFTPSQFFLLHEAIHEMLCKGDELRAALTDGENAPAVPLPEQTEANALGSEKMGWLTYLADEGSRIWPNHSAFAPLLKRGFIECVGNPSHGPGYVITDAGRRVLTEHSNAS